MNAAISPRSRHRRGAWCSALGLAAGLAGIAGCGTRPDGPGPFRGAPVIVVSIDTLRADRLPAYGYRGVETPALDALRAESVLFRHAYSHYPLTLPSHASLLSGLLPTRHGVRDNMGYPFDPKSFAPPKAAASGGASASAGAAGGGRSLAELLAAAGYATGGFVSSFVLRRETGIDVGFGTYDSEIEIAAGASLDSAQRAGLDTVARAAAWVREQGERPYFLFLHLYEPHAPYTPPEPFASRYAAEPYDGEVATVDLVLGGFFDELRRLGHWDRAVVVLLSDHGEGLGDHGEAQHGVFLYAATLHVPLMVKLPGAARGGTTSDRVAALVDVYPTVSGLLGLETPSGLDGRPLLDQATEELVAAGKDDRAVYAESFYPRLHYGWSDLQALIDRQYWFIQAPEPELYDQAKDPAQTTNILRDERRAYAERRDRLAALEVPLAAPAAVDEETARKLAALGYLSGSVHTSGPLPDPKSQRHLLAEMQDGWRKFAAADYAGAAVHFRNLVEANPQMLDIWGFLGRSLKHLGRTAESVAAFQRALELSGGDPQLALAVASGQLELGQLGDARRHAELALAANPQSAGELLARIEVAEGRDDQALERIAAAAAAGTATEPMLRRLARARLEAGAPRAAVELLAAHADGEPATQALLGLALGETGRLREAEELLRRALAADDQAPRAHEGLGIVLLRQGRAEEARVSLERALALDERLPDAWTSLGVALYGLAGPRAAIAAWQRAVAIDPQQLDALFNLGLVAADLGERALARESLGRFVREANGPARAADRAKAAAVLRELGG
jgi:choline-sulfatase